MRFWVLIIFLGFLSGSNAQTSVSFPDSAARWVNAGYDVGQWSLSLVYSEFMCANGEDTTINAQSYSKLNWCLSGDYKGAFRDTLGKVYYVPKDSVSERLIYDFLAMPGDTVHFYYEDAIFGIGEYDYVVQNWDTSTIVMNGVPRRQLFIESGFWIEGIGCTQGFLQSPFGNISNYAPYLYCMSHVDTILYDVSASNSGTEVSCDLFIGLEENEIQKIVVAPNPAHEYFSFSSESTPEQIWITDASGRSFSVGFTEELGGYSVSVHQFAVGSYTVSIISEGKIYRSKLIIR